MAECVKKSVIDETIIECETKKTTTYSLLGFTENNKKTSITPIYQDNSIYAILEIIGININNNHYNHVLDIGNPNNSINPRIDVNIDSFSNKLGNEIINIYGADSSNNFSSLRIQNFKNNSGNLTINGEFKNNVNIENATINGNYYITNIVSNLNNISVEDIFVNNSILNLNEDGIVEINNINLDTNSDIFIASNGNIGSIYTVGDIFFSGVNSSIHVNKIESFGNIILSNNMEVIIDNITNNNKIIFSGVGKLTSNNLDLKEINLIGDATNRSFNNGYINIINDITTNNISISNIKLDFFAKNIIAKEKISLENSFVNFQSNVTANKINIKQSYINSDHDLKISEMIITNTGVKFKDIFIDNSLLIDNSLVKVDQFNFISFEEEATLELNFSDNIIHNKIISQGSLKNGIYSYGDINIFNNVKLNMILSGSDKIKQGEAITTEIMYSKNGTINYNPNSLLLNGNSDIFSIDYYLLKDKGTSFIIEIKRELSYCGALSKAGIACNSSNNLEYTGDSFVTDTAKILDNIIKEGISVTENLSSLISGLDKSSLENLENNLASLKPISNDVLVFESYQSSTFIKDLHSNSDKNFVVFTANSKIADNIFHDLSNTSLLGVYYGFSFYDNLSFGVALSKSNITNSLYDVDNTGVTVLSSYDLKLNNLNFNFIGSYGLNKYDRNKINFNQSVAQSSSILNNASFRVEIYQDYFIKDLKIIPKFYYDISYLHLSAYKERGEGYLYDVLANKSIINNLNTGFDASYKILSAGFNIFYLGYFSGDLLAKPYEATDNYIEFEKAMYSGLGFSANLGIDYEIKNIDFNLSYNGYYYDNKSFFNGLTLKVNF